MKWETVIGLEAHVQLSTKTKLFSRASTMFGDEANTNVNLVDCGLPGVLPTVNKNAFYILLTAWPEYLNFIKKLLRVLG